MSYNAAFFPFQYHIARFIFASLVVGYTSMISKLYRYCMPFIAIEEFLEPVIDYAVKAGIIEDITVQRALFDTRVDNTSFQKPSG